MKISLRRYKENSAALAKHQTMKNKSNTTKIPQFMLSLQHFREQTLNSFNSKRGFEGKNQFQTQYLKGKDQIYSNCSISCDSTTDANDTPKKTNYRTEVGRKECNFSNAQQIPNYNRTKSIADLNNSSFNHRPSNCDSDTSYFTVVKRDSEKDINNFSLSSAIAYASVPKRKTKSGVSTKLDSKSKSLKKCKPKSKMSAILNCNRSVEVLPNPFKKYNRSRQQVLSNFQGDSFSPQSLVEESFLSVDSQAQSMNPQGNITPSLNMTSKACSLPLSKVRLDMATKLCKGLDSEIAKKIKRVIELQEELEGASMLNTDLRIEISNLTLTKFSINN